jgi:hypothetical protein
MGILDEGFGIMVSQKTPDPQEVETQVREACRGNDRNAPRGGGGCYILMHIIEYK